jgi:hypothetical protein
MRLGGRVRTAEFAAAVQGLLGEGALIEVWLRSLGRREPAHVLLLPGCSAALKNPVVRARGLDEAMAGEAWYRSVVARGVP